MTGRVAGDHVAMGVVLGALEHHRGAVVSAELLPGLAESAAADGWRVTPVVATAASSTIPLSPFSGLLPAGTGTDPLDRLRVLVATIGQGGARTILTIDDARWLDEMSVLALRHLHASTEARFLLGVGGEGHVPEGALAVIGDGPRLDPAPRHDPGAILGLRADEREAFDALRLAEPLGRALLERLVPAATIDDLVARGLLVASSVGHRTELRLARPVDGGDAVPPALRRRLVDALDATGSCRYGDRLRLALLRADLGDLDDPTELVTAAHDLERVHHRSVFSGVGGGLAEPLPACLDAALRLARRALDITNRMPELLEVVNLLSALGRSAEAAPLLADLDRYVVDEADRAMATRLRAQVLYVMGLPVAARDMLLEAEAVTLDVEHRTWFRVARLQIEAIAGRYRDAVATGDLLRADGVEPASGTGAGALAVSLVRVGRCEDALAVLDTVFATVTGDEDPRFVVAEAYAQLLALAMLGRLDEADDRAAAAAAVHAAAGDHQQEAFAHAAMAALALGRGRVRTAAELSDRVLSGLAHRDVFGLRRVALAVAVIAHAHLGEADRAAELLVDLDVTPAGVHAFEGEVRRAVAWSLACEGDVSGAALVLVEAAAVARDEGLAGEEVSVLADLVRLGRAERAVGRLEALAETTQGPFAALARDHARGLVAGDGDRLDEVAARAAAIGANLLALDAAAHAEAAHAAAGRSAQAAAARQRVEQLLDTCGMTTTPALAGRGR